jgi:hypothetical protein
VAGGEGSAWRDNEPSGVGSSEGAVGSKVRHDVTVVVGP